jgi:hypothetical protein
MVSGDGEVGVCEESNEQKSERVKEDLAIFFLRLFFSHRCCLLLSWSGY